MVQIQKMYVFVIIVVIVKRSFLNYLSIIFIIMTRIIEWDDKVKFKKRKRWSCSPNK